MAKRIDLFIEFRLLQGQLGELVGVFKHMLDCFDRKDALEGLLYEHVLDMNLRLGDMAIKTGVYAQKSAVLSLTHAEAAAMHEIISTTDTSKFPYANVILGDWLQKIDKRRRAVRNGQ